MRIHELLERSVDYIALDGVLGTDPDLLQDHLQVHDPSNDNDFFAFIWSTLVQHPSIRVIVLAYPISRADGSIDLGTAPLPPDYITPAEDGAPRVNSSLPVKGRAAAYAAQGDEYRTSKEAISDKREKLLLSKAQKKAGKTSVKTQHGTENVTRQEVYRVLKDVDGVAEPETPKTNLPALKRKWGSRLRVRCVDDEIYHRLTGSYQKVNKITPVVLHVLQLAAQSREKGITAVELGPLVGSSQGSMFYFMKVLVDMGLCVKVPATYHGAVTNILIYHRFVDQNENFRNYDRQQKAILGIQSGQDGQLADPEESNPTSAGLTGNEFPPLKEIELVTGHVVQERLVQLLDSPSLANHLLKMVHIVEIVGWRGKTTSKHRRTVIRHIQRLVDKGIVERLVVGEQNVRCLRLTKYNPDGPSLAVSNAEEMEEEDVQEMERQETEDLRSLDRMNAPYTRTGMTAITLALEYQMFRFACDSGLSGVTIQDISDHFDGVFKRAIDFQLLRVERFPVMPHLGYTAICSAIESFGRERRVRIYGSESYKQVMLASGQAVDPTKMPSNPAAQGHWQGTSHRRFYDSLEVMYHFLDDGQVAKIKPNAAASKKVGRPPKVTRSAAAIASGSMDAHPTSIVLEPEAVGLLPGATSPEPVDDDDDNDQSLAKLGKKRAMLYDSTTQVRGRPRKYIHVVEPDGRRNRKVIGLMRPRPGLPSLLIYVPLAKKLVEAPPGYSGLGPAPPLTEEEIRAGKPPSFYLNLPDYDAPDEEEATPIATAQPSSKSAKRQKTIQVKKRALASEGRHGAPEEDQSAESSLNHDTHRALATLLGSSASSTLAGRPQHASSDFHRPEAPDTSVAAIIRHSGTTPRTPKPIEQRSTEPVNVQTVESGPTAPIMSGRAGKRSLSPRISPDPTPPTQQPKSKKARTDQVKIPISRADHTPIASSVDTASTAHASADAAAGLTAEISRIPHDASQTPSREVKTNARVPQPKVRLPNTTQAAPGPRIDLGAVRRHNELVQCLIDSGGVMSDARLYHEHRIWSEKWVGRDHPHAPLVVTGMDRGLFRRLVGNLLREGRIMESKPTLPTTTGRWTKTSILYTPDTPKATRDAYIRTLASDGIYTPPKRTKIAAAAYGELKVPKPGRAAPTLQQPQMAHDLDRRSLLLSEPSVVAFLYGYQQNRNARLKTYHQAILRAIGHAQTSAIVSTSPRIFSTSLLFEDFEVGDFFANIYTTSYNEELEVYLRDPENRKTRIADLPSHLSPRRGFAGQGAKLKMGTLMAALCSLKIASALSATSDVQAPIHFTGPDGVSGYFNFQEPSGLAGYYILHDWVPLYHLAVDSCDFIRAYPATDEGQVEEFWSLVQSAALEVDGSILPAREPLVNLGPPQAAYCPVALQLPIDQLKMIRSAHRWTAKPRLLPSQQAALRAAVDESGNINVQAPADIDQLAWENALTPSFVHSQLALLSERTRFQYERLRAMRREEYEKSQRRQKAAEESLQRKIAQSRAVGKAAWEARVRDACAAVGTEYSEELQAFVGRNIVSAVRMTAVNDDAIKQQVKIWMRAHQTWDGDPRAAMPPPQHPLPPTIVRSIQARKPRKDRKAREINDSEAPHGRLSRRRRNWTAQDDELLLDAEAIIRARSRNIPANKGRTAMLQIFPDVGIQTFRTRLKKLFFEAPGKKTYCEMLEEVWYEMWRDRRLAHELPDPNPQSIIDFDLSAHLDYLRTHVNKLNIRLSVVTNTEAPSKERAPDLPLCLSDLLEDLSWTYRVGPEKTFAAFHDTIQSEESRTRQLSFVPMRQASGLPRILRDSAADALRKGQCRAALMMILATSNDIYDQTVASQLLKPFNPGTDVDPIVSTMTRDKVIHRNTSAAHTKRYYSFTASWRAMCEGPFPDDLYSDAASLGSTLASRGGDMAWNMLGTGGEVASLMSLVSNHEVQFETYVKDLPALKMFGSVLNTRKMGDEHFEFGVRVRSDPAHFKQQQTVLSPVGADPALPAEWEAGYLPVTAQIVEQAIEVVQQAGPSGMSKDQIMTALHCEPQNLDAVLATIAKSSSDRVFWAGYDTARLVHRAYWSTWSVVVRRPPSASEIANEGESDTEKRIAPRRWYDIYGTFLSTEYRIAARAVTGHVISRPGQTESVLRNKLETILDRLEINELLQHLLIKGVVKRSWAVRQERTLPPVEATDQSEEDDIVWFGTSTAFVVS